MRSDSLSFKAKRMTRAFLLTFVTGALLFAVAAWWASYQQIPDVGGWRLFG